MDTLSIHMNARVRGMKSRLLSRQQFDALLDLDDVERLTQSLLDSPYKSEMAEALTQYQGADAVEEAVSRNLAETFRSLQRIAKDDLREPADRFLARWDLMGVKALLRNRHHGIDVQEGMESLTPGPSLSVALMNEFAGKPSMDELVAALASWNSDLCGPLVKNLGAYHESGALDILENALDRGYFEGTISSLSTRKDANSRLICQVLRMEIDRINLRLLMQRRGTGTTAENKIEQLMPGGLVSKSILLEVAAAQDGAEAMKHLEKTKYADLVGRLYTLVQTGRFAPLDRLFELLLIHYLARESRVHVMTLAIFMHYTWLKHNEVINLRMIARGEARHMPRGRVREEVMYV